MARPGTSTRAGTDRNRDRRVDDNALITTGPPTPPPGFGGAPSSLDGGTPSTTFDDDLDGGDT